LPGGGILVEINFELYKVFYQVAKYLNFSQAAAELYISQSAVSQSIKLLEEKLGCRLFFRHTKQVSLTEAGRLLFSHVEQAYNFLKSGEGQIEALQALKQGEVRLGATDTICKHYLLPHFQQFATAYPGIKLNITSRTSPGCLDLLSRGRVDLVVVNLPETSLPAGLRVEMVRSLQDVFIAGPAFSHLRDRDIPLAELIRHPLMLLEKNTTTRDFLEQLAAEHKLQLTPEIELDSVDLLIQLAKIGLGITFVARDYVAAELARDEVIELKIKEAIPERKLGIVTHAKIPLPVAAQKLMDLILASHGFQTPADQ
ncbi:MAG TPA: LysR family transcriptional regulator, partial [Bacillota bacterium]|nr:LysR family transcriptional regulator [Bacillota bacterium]